MKNELASVDVGAGAVDRTPMPRIAKKPRVWLNGKGFREEKNVLGNFQKLRVWGPGPEPAF